MSLKWDEWLLNDVNDRDCFLLMGAESRGTQEVVQAILSHSETNDEWLLNDVNDSLMIWMSLKWDEWLLNDVNDTDCFPLTGAESRGTQEVVQTILSHSEADDEWLSNEVEFVIPQFFHNGSNDGKMRFRLRNDSENAWMMPKWVEWQEFLDKRPMAWIFDIIPSGPIRGLDIHYTLYNTTLSIYPIVHLLIPPYGLVMLPICPISTPWHGCIY